MDTKYGKVTMISIKGNILYDIGTTDSLGLPIYYWSKARAIEVLEKIYYKKLEPKCD